MSYENYNPRAALLAQARDLLTRAAQAAMADGSLPEAELPGFIVEIPADPKNGDVASNLAMAGARAFRKAPRMIAEAITAHLPELTGTNFDRVEIAGPGFINLYASLSWFTDVVRAASENPARSIGVDNDYGSLAAGRYGNVILADKELNIKAVIQKGTRIV